MRQPSAPRRPRVAPDPPSGPADSGADLVLSPEEIAAFAEFGAQEQAAVAENLLPEDADLLGEDAAPESLPDSGGAPGVAAPSVSQIDARLAERRRSARRVGWIRIGVGAGTLALLAGLIWLVAVSPVFALRADQIQVTGEGGYLDPAAAAAVVATKDGTPLVRLDTGALAAEVAAAPAVAEAAVVRAWPNGVTVALTPREPVAVAAAGGELVDLVGPDGVVVVSVPPEAAPPDLPVLAVDMAGEGGEATALAVLSVLEQLPPQLRAQVASAGATSLEAITLTLDSGAQVVWGSAAQSDLKAQVLLVLLQVPAQRYDVSAPEAPRTS